jgi:hypothetical protein
LTKCVSVAPISFALRFIAFTDSASEPATCSATLTAASFAERISIA